MEPTYRDYLNDEALRDEIVRRAHRERAEAMYRFLAQAAAALRLPPPRIAAPRTDACA